MTKLNNYLQQLAIVEGFGGSNLLWQWLRPDMKTKRATLARSNTAPISPRKTNPSTTRALALPCSQGISTSPRHEVTDYRMSLQESMSKTRPEASILEELQINTIPQTKIPRSAVLEASTSQCVSPRVDLCPHNKENVPDLRKSLKNISNPRTRKPPTKSNGALPQRPKQTQSQRKKQSRSQTLLPTDKLIVNQELYCPSDIPANQIVFKRFPPISVVTASMVMPNSLNYIFGYSLKQTLNPIN